MEEDPDARKIPVRDFAGAVVAIDDLAHDVKGVRLARRRRPIDFQAGQYVNVTLPGVEGSRAFSIANAPSDSGHVELQIRLVPGGAGTSYVHEKLKVGDMLSFNGPSGRFIVRKSRGGPKLFLAGGTGVSSPRSMILDLLEEGYAEPITLVHGVRTEADLYGREDVRGAGRQASEFPLCAGPVGRARGQRLEGRARLRARRRQACSMAAQFEGNTAYLCGPPLMIEGCIGALMQGRLFEKHIFTERFFTARDCAEKPKSPLFKRL